MKKRINTKRICFIAIFAGLSVVLYTLIPKFSLPIFPGFLEINFSMIPILICAFMLGPVDAAICVVIRCLVKLPMSGTSYVGEIADLLIGLPTAVVASSLYHYVKWKHKGLLSLMSVVVVWIVMGVLTNALINIPFYSTMYGGMEVIVSFCSDAIKVISFGHITNLTTQNFMGYYLLFAVIPFNLLLSVVVTLFTALVHQRIKVLYDKI